MHSIEISVVLTGGIPRAESAEAVGEVVDGFHVVVVVARRQIGESDEFECRRRRAGVAGSPTKVRGKSDCTATV